MVRELPPLASQFEMEANRYVNMATELEALRFHVEKGYVHFLSTYRVELYHELAYLRIFLAWEEFLENLLIRLMCGYKWRGVQETPLATFSSDLRQAELQMLNGQSYVLWHNTQKNINRVSAHLRNANMASVLGSHATKLDQYSAIRHRIAHNQSDAIKKFDAVVRALTGKTYLASSAGKYLRDLATSNPSPRSWLEEVSNDLVSLAKQMAS